MIELRNLTAGYGPEPVLKGVDLLCPQGTVTTLVGKNGCGKSTLLKAALGMLPLESGEARLDGGTISGLSSREIAQRAAYLAQGKNIPEITAYKLVLHGRFPYLSYPRKYRQGDEQIAWQAMEEMGVAHLAQERLGKLSGGTRQKVYIAMALCQQSGNILMDEPTT